MTLSEGDMDRMPMQVHVVAIEDAADGLRLLRLARPGGADLPGWDPGAHLEFLLPGGLRRQYSLCGLRAARAEWSIGVLRDRSGRAALPTCMAFLDRLAGYGDRVVLSPANECGVLDLRAALAAGRPGTLVHACGPEPLLVAIQERAAEADLQVHLERFAAGSQATSAGTTNFEIELARTGAVTRVPADQSILDVLASTSRPRVGKVTAAPARPRSSTGSLTTGTAPSAKRNAATGTR